MKAAARRICTVEGCGRPHRRNGFCDTHDQRMKRTGTTDAPKRQTFAERFWEKVDKRGPTECWEWTAAVNEHGYGVMRPEGRRVGPTVKAHRASLELAGVNTEGQFVLHACDNRQCVNPAHLSVGNHQANVADMMSRERQARGSRSGVAKLTESQVASIRARAAKGDLHRVIAADYGISRVNVTRIVNRQGWTHVP